MPFSRADLDHVLKTAPVQWEDLRNRRLLLTGGTGFVGTWLLASFVWINSTLGLNARVTVVSRRPESFARRMREVACDPAVELLRGDVASFEVPGPFDFAIHAASEEAADKSASALLAKADADIAGTGNVLAVTRRANVQRMLFTSSGAVYGVQPPALTLVDEDFDGAPDPNDPRAAYGRAKRQSEAMCARAADERLACLIARCFAFVGPLLPQGAGYAAGDFLGDVVHGGPVTVTGDGTPVRSYLYAADLAIWLWTILLRGRSCRPYNVGSDRPVRIRDLAQQIARLAQPPADVRIERPSPAPASSPPRYVPSIRRAQRELGLNVFVDLDDALARTWTWMQERGEASP